MTDVHVKIQVTTSEFGEDFVLTENINEAPSTVDLFHYEFDRDDNMTCFDKMLAEFEIIVGEHVKAPVKLRWLNTEDETKQYFFFRIPKYPLGMEYNSVLVKVSNINDGEEHTMEFYTFLSVPPEDRTPGVYEYINVGHFSEHVVSDYSDF